MITYLEGEILEKNLQSVVVKTGGVGYEVFVTPKIVQEIKVGEAVKFWTYHSVKENALDLFGFNTKEDLSFFKLLLTISGIGPKTALSILSTASVETLRDGITSGDSAYLSKISGIGKKMAEKILLGLKDKLGIIDMTEDRNNHSVVTIDALVALGYSEREVREVIKKIEKSDNPEKMIKEALKIIGKK